ncbi:MAG TPA: hypothetical protein VNA14_03195 [Mycobacteriales bacterium]|nr:hypothetical protein [Mycobacteriales bacterium]
MRIRYVAAVAALCITALAGGAAADHTDPDSVTPIQDGPPAIAVSMPLAAWTHLANFVANPGTDLKFFERDGVSYAAAGTLGGGAAGHAGQRIIKLVDADGTVAPEFVGDHGSAACGGPGQGTGSLGLQHDPTVTPRKQTELVIDATDAVFRCHDPGGAGLELIDVTGIAGVPDGDSLREVHLTRHDGFSHTNTVDANRPWIVYNSTTDGGRPWIDVVDIRTCLGNEDDPLETKREKCRPKVFRIPLKAAWTGRATETDGQPSDEDTGNGCHDITSRGTRLYCAAIKATVVIDVRDLTDAQGNVRGTPLPCTVEDGTATTAKVTDCDFVDGTAAADDLEHWQKLGRPAATGWTYVTSYNHGPSSTSPRADVAISHEADPTPDHDFMFITDERGGGVSPPGAACTPPNIDNPQGNGGIHVIDISDPVKPAYAVDALGNKAIYITRNTIPSPTFCTVHVIEQAPEEQRLFMAWYSQGIKVVDWDIADDGTWAFEEVAYYNTPGNAIWTAEVFRTQDNADGTRTYWIMTSDIARGVDVVQLTLEPNPLSDHTPTDRPALRPGAQPAPGGPGGGSSPAPAPRPRPRPRPAPLPATGADFALLGFAAGAIVVAAGIRRLRAA